MLQEQRPDQTERREGLGYACGFTHTVRTTGSGERGGLSPYGTWPAQSCCFCGDAFVRVCAAVPEVGPGQWPMPHAHSTIPPLNRMIPHFPGHIHIEQPRTRPSKLHVKWWRARAQT